VEIDNDFSSFFDLYFGEGMDTDLAAKLRLDQLRYLGILRAEQKFFDHWAAGPLAYDRVRREEGINGDPSLRLIAGEDTFALGAFVKYDSRDDEFSPSRGLYSELRAWNHPGGDGFSQAEIDLRGFTSPMEGLVLAGRLAGGVSASQPSYLYRFELGGSDFMRGYYGNRFRGRDYYAVQAELRFPIWKFLSGDAFGDFGEATDDSFHGDAKTTGGLGLRIALPPSGMMKARIDYGFASDQSGLYVAFGHAF
jgi:outer membrane protein assembly factor BamA